MNKDTIQALEGLYLAICSALPNDAVRTANNTLAEMADSAPTPLVPAIVYRQLVYAVEPLIQPASAVVTTTTDANAYLARASA